MTCGPRTQSSPSSPGAASCAGLGIDEPAFGVRRRGPDAAGLAWPGGAKWLTGLISVMP